MPCFPLAVVSVDLFPRGVDFARKRPKTPEQNKLSYGDGYPRRENSRKWRSVACSNIFEIFKGLHAMY